MLIDVANHRLIGGDFLFFMVHSYKLLLFLLFCFFFFFKWKHSFLKKKKSPGVHLCIIHASLFLVSVIVNRSVLACLATRFCSDVAVMPLMRHPIRLKYNNLPM